MKKLFLEAIVHVLHIYTCFLQEEQIFNFTQDFIVNCSGKKFSKYYSGLKHNLHRNIIQPLVRKK